VLVSVSALAQTGQLSAVPPGAVHEVNRDLALERAASARSSRLAAVLKPEARGRLDLAARALLAQLDSAPGSADPYALARREVRSRFGRLSAEQSDLLSFYVLAEVARLLSQPEQPADQRGGMNEMSEMTSLRLQMTMDRRSKFMSALSNIMKKIATTQDALVENVK
jgi:hypothetical protein